MNYFALLLLFQIIASISHIFSKQLITHLSPEVILLLRCGMTALIFIIIFIVKRKKIVIKLKLYDALLLFVLGVLSVPLNQYLATAAFLYTYPPNIALSYALLPVLVLIFSIIIINEKPTIIKTIGIILAFVGTVVIILENGFDLASDNTKGNLMALGGCLAYVFYTILGKGFSIKYGAIYSTGLAMIVGFILYIPVFIFIGNPIEFKIITTIDWLKIAYLAMLLSVLGYAIWYYALARTDPSKVAVFNNIQPVLTTILSVIFLQHSLSITFIVGGLLIISGVIFTQKG